MKTQPPAPHIDVEAIPDFQRRQLAEGALALTRQVFSQPGAEERFQAWLAEREKKGVR